jgi:heterodisulfide reductase subunit A-like polyferredoxin
LSQGTASGGAGAGERVGLFLCRCGGNLGRIVGIDALAEPARWPVGTHVAVHDLLCAPEGIAWLRERIREEGLDRAVVGACSPGEHEATFRAAAAEEGRSPWNVHLVNLREQVEWIEGDPVEATARAERLLRAGLARVALHRDLPRREVEASPDVLVIGGGAAGLAAARTLAGPARRAIVIEREFALGGFAARSDAPLLEGACGSCVVSPVIDELLHDPAVEVLTGAEVTAVRGSFGRFDVEVRRRARHVDAERCLGCPACVEACPVEWSDPRDGGRPRRAIGMPWEGCLPYVPAIDPARCSALQGGACRACGDACAVGAIRLDEEDHLHELHVGAIVVATGSTLRTSRGAPVESPAEGSDALARMLRIEAGEDGFLDDVGPSPFEPTAARVAGIFVAGAAAGPRALRAAIRDGVAAAGTILALLRPGERLLVEPLAPAVLASACCGCGACVTACAFGAVRRDAATGRVRVEPLHCRGCGGCAAACPTGAMGAPHQTRGQIAAEISALLAPEGTR